ncbi:MAG: hypothetical protein R3E32_07670 [Chitinophagales bacterium]
MTKEEYLELALSYWASFESLKKEESFYDYEKGFEGVILKFGQDLLESSISKPEKTVVKKNNSKSIWLYLYRQNAYVE